MNNLQKLNNVLEEKSPNQELINDLHRTARKILDTKSLLDKLADDLPGKHIELKQAIKKLEELDVDIEYVTHQIEKL